MKRPARAVTGKTAIELIEEATHVLRLTGSATLAIYYLGTIPFALGLLYFWADMSRSPYAGQHLAETSLAVTALFILMKFCQALFARRVRAHLAAEEKPRYDLRDYARILLFQAVIQPSGLFIIPIALIVTLPFGWVFAFYQNVTALGGLSLSSVSDLTKRASKQSLLWPWQNHLVIGIASAFGIVVFLNWVLVAISLPGLLKTLFGVESIFTQSTLAMMNSTFFAAMIVLTYLTMDPLVKTVYALRCFYGESLQSGEDLKADLKRFAIPLRRLASVVLIAILLAAGRIGAAPQPAPPVSAEELNHRIDEVIHGRKYAWRLPRQPIAETEAREEGVIARFFGRIGSMARNVVRTVIRWFADVIRRIIDSSDAGRGRLPGLGWASSSLLLYGLLAAVVSVFAVFLVRVWRGRRRSATITVQPLTAHEAPDVRDESVSADQLPEDGWTRLARQLLEEGEFRLAMRAFYLATLAHLAQHNLISIARFKSNRDYEKELRRRGHGRGELLPVFGENLSVFESIWYGMHEVNGDSVRQFAANVDKIRNAI